MHHWIKTRITRNIRLIIYKYIEDIEKANSLAEEITNMLSTKKYLKRFK